MAKKARPVKGTKEKKHVIEKEKVKARGGKQSSPEPAADTPRAARATRKGAADKSVGSADASGTETSGDDASKSSRLTLIKTMHEARKREFEQIREELDADEEE